MSGAIVWVMVLLMRTADNTSVTLAPTPGTIPEVFSSQDNCEMVKSTVNPVVPVGTWLECQKVKVW